MVKKELAHHPDVLFLQVLRYDFDSTSEGSKKVKRTITLSPTLVVQGATYHLIFVTFHSGSQASQGHYTCRAKEPFSKKWHKFTDKSTEESSLPKNSYAATLLVYEKFIEDDQKTTLMLHELRGLRESVMNRETQQIKMRAKDDGAGNIVTQYLANVVSRSSSA